jgi:Zn finger protein HypA/HybF involved in hydrogenase expression
MTQKSMHDFHLADLIYKAIIEEAEKNNLKKITKAVIELGSIIEHGEEVLPANLEFNIKMLAEGGIADGIGLVITPSDHKKWVLKEIEGD